MKKILCILALAIALVCVLSSCNKPFLPGQETTPAVPDAPFTPSVGLAYEINDDGKTCSITGIETCTDTDIYIGGSIDGYKVTSIGDRAFYECSPLRSVTIGDSVTSIGDRAFYECCSLRSVTIGDSVTSIGDRAFSDCTALTSVTIGDSVTSIGYMAFYECYSLKSVTIGDSVKSIGNCAFSWCTSLTSVTIPDSVTSIGNSAFSWCTSLTSVTIPDSVTSIGIGAFDDCNSALYTEYGLVKYVGNETNPYAVLIAVTNKNKSTYAIHPDTKVIAYGAFQYCSRLTSIIIPDGVRGIGDSAFYQCSNLTSVTIGDSVTTIGSSAFYWCPNLKSVTFANPNGWECENLYDSTCVAISASDLSHPETAAQYLISAYLDYYWHRTE